MAIRVEDPRSSLHHFKALMEDRKRGLGDLYGITFNNINIAVLGEQEVLRRLEDGLRYDLVFDSVTIGGERVESVNYSYHNEFV